MSIKFYQSEVGNITVAAIGNDLLINVTSPGSFIVSNPAISKTGRVHEIEISERQTPEQIFEAINDHLKQIV